MVSIPFSVEEFVAQIDRYLEKGVRPKTALHKAIVELAKEYLLQVESVTVSGFPLGSMAVSGKFKDKVFVTRKGELTHVRAYVKPFDPRTAAQLAQRTKFARAVSNWKHLPDSEKEHWNQLARKAGKHSGYHYFIEQQFQV